MKSKDVFPAVFGRHAAAYRDRILPPFQRGEARGRLLAIELLRLRAGECVLDLACGPGTLTHHLAGVVGPGGLVLAADLAEGMVRLAREGAPANVAVALMDAEHLGVRDAALDAAICGHGFQFFPDLGSALLELRRVLRPGGRITASFPASHPERKAKALLVEILAELPAAPQVPDQAPTLAILEDPARVRAAARAAAFASARVERVEETISYASPEELVSRMFGWWDCAWRLEPVSAARQAELRSHAVEALRHQLGDGPLQLPGATHVLLAEA
jgi:SAM-dependent methyltransferase